MENIIQVIQSYQEDDELINPFNFYLKELQSWHGGDLDIMYYNAFDNEMSEEELNKYLKNLVFLRSTTINDDEKKLFYFHIYSQQIYEILITPEGYSGTPGCCGSYSYIKIVVSPSTEFQKENYSSDEYY